MNNCVFTGNLGRDPEMTYTPKGMAVAKASMACTKWSKDPQTNQFREKTTWVNLVAFGYNAEKLNNRGQRGTQVSVVCEYSNRTYEDKQGVTRSWHEFIVEHIEFGKNAVPATPEPEAPIPDIDPETGERF